MKFFTYQSIKLDRENQSDSSIYNALRIAMKAHKNQKDKGGTPYICHTLEVAMAQKTLDGVICGLLHDVVEDAYYTFDALQELGLPDHIIEALKLLTRRKGESYKEYIEKIKLNELATAVKIADLKHNMDLSRIPASKITCKDDGRCEKYREALEYLTDKDDQLCEYVKESLKSTLTRVIQEDCLDDIIEKILPDIVKNIKECDTWKKTWAYGLDDLKMATAKALMKNISKESQEKDSKTSQEGA